MRKVLPFLLLISISLVNAQNIETLKPKLGSENNYSKAAFDYWKKATDLLSQIDNLKNEIHYSEINLNNKKAIDSLEMGYGPSTKVVGCSYYCSGGPYKIVSSSLLKDNQNCSEQNIHDFDLFTGWIPKSENGIGESISFHFKGEASRINAIVIYNGNIKTKELWKNNSRAKKVKLKIDNKTIAILELKDTTASQRFEIEPIQATTDDQDLVLTLEILEAYRGAKYTALVISEINFDGIDDH